MAETYEFTLEMAVRDYECDLQGVVNNAVYLNYLEHARHAYLRSVGEDFAAITASGIHLVVVRAELDYRLALRSGDRFLVGVNTRRVSRVRFGFDQEILRVPDERVVMNGTIIGTALNDKGRPFAPALIDRLFPMKTP